MSRTSVVLGLGLLWAGFTTTLGCSQRANEGRVLTKDTQQSLTPDQVIEELRAGNERFVRGSMIKRDYLAQVEATASGQYPKAAVLSCVDSRVPVELVFDQGIGDIFVGRVAGNVEDDILMGSLEFATGVAGSKLIVILGHTECGAVKGTIDREAVADLGFDKLNALIEVIDPAVDASLNEGEERSSSNHELVERAIRKNVTLTIDRIRERSPTLRTMEEQGTIRMVGAIYNISTGTITWL